MNIIKEKRLEKNMTLEQVGNLVGVGKSTVRKWENGMIENMGRDKIVALSKALNISPLEILGVDEQTVSSDITYIYSQLNTDRRKKVYTYAETQLKEQNIAEEKLTSLEAYKERRTQAKELSTIDWYGIASAGTGEFQDGSGVKEEIKLPVEIIPADADFCLSINGTSMQPVFQDGDYVFVKEQVELFSGAIGVVIVNGEAFLKRIWFEDNHARLESFNKKYDDIFVTENDDFRIVGKVVM